MARLVSILSAPAATTPALFSLLIPAACQGPDGGSAVQSVTVRDSAGIAIVESAGPALAPSGWTLSSEPTLRIGAVEGEGAEQFTVVRGVTQLADGRIVVLDQETSEIRYFDASGEHLRTVGGEGGGPGEFNRAGRLVRLSDDSVLVEDRPRIRYVVYGPDGELASEATVDMERIVELTRYECSSFGTFPDRSLIGCVDWPGGAEPIQVGNFSHIGTGRVRALDRLIWIRPGLSRADTLGSYGGIETYGYEVRGGAAVGYMTHPFYSRTEITTSTSPPRLFVAVNPEYSIEVWAPGGVLERIIRRPGARRVAGAALREAAWDVLARRAEDDPQRFNQLRAEIPVPDSLPAVTSLVAAPGGELWAGRSLAIEEGPRVFDVFDPEGRFLTTVELPERFVLHEVGADYVLGAWTDATDVPFVELYALERDAP